jgi:hypothetical protein
MGTMILAHYHPSNDQEPSYDDTAVTQTIIRTADIVGIKVHEHLIISIRNLGIEKAVLFQDPNKTTTTAPSTAATFTAVGIIIAI